jgi:Flp pilus assembly CpaF family ATPase
MDAATDRHRLLLTAYERARRALFADLLERPGVTTLLVLPPRVPGDPCRLVLAGGERPEPAGTAEPGAVMRFLALASGLNAKELRRDRPTLDLVLPGGERLHADIDPVAPGPACAIRRPWRGAVTLTDLERLAMLSRAQAGVLSSLIAARVSIVIAGEVASGKTTLLRACLHEPAFMDGLPAVLQDPPEFTAPCPHAWPLAADPLAEPPVTLEALVAGALRVPITHLVIGEVRRAEAHQMIVAWTTGHPGLCTVHAGSAADALERIAQMVGLSGVAIDALQLRWIAKAVGAVVHLAVDPATGRRRASEIVAVEGWHPEDGFRLRRLA